MSACSTPSGRGEFATARRGGLTPAEIREIEAHRAKDRPTPWRALARRYGRPEADIKALFIKPDNDDKAEHWPFGACEDDVKDQIKAVAKRHRLTLDQMADASVRGRAAVRIRAAQRECYSVIYRAFPRLTMVDLSVIFDRSQACLWRDLMDHERGAA